MSGEPVERPRGDQGARALAIARALLRELNDAMKSPRGDYYQGDLADPNRALHIVERHVAAALQEPRGQHLEMLLAFYLKHRCDEQQFCQSCDDMDAFVYGGAGSPAPAAAPREICDVCFVTMAGELVACAEHARRADAGVRPIAVVTKTPEGLRVELGEVRAADRPATTPPRMIDAINAGDRSAEDAGDVMFDESAGEGRADAGVSDYERGRLDGANEEAARHADCCVDREEFARLRGAGVSDAALARVIWETRSNIALRPGPPLPSSDWERIWRERLTPEERDAWMTVVRAVRAALAGGQG